MHAYKINSQTLAIKCITGTGLWETAQENQTVVKTFFDTDRIVQETRYA